MEIQASNLAESERDSTLADMSVYYKNKSCVFPLTAFLKTGSACKTEFFHYAEIVKGDF